YACTIISTIHHIFFLSFSSSTDPPYLHSFPTRRSSDLNFPRRFLFLAGVHRRAGISISRPARPAHHSTSHLPRCAGRAGREIERSEEHTSELQSLAYLVCRLLLEKKKKN